MESLHGTYYPDLDPVLFTDVEYHDTDDYVDLGECLNERLDHIATDRSRDHRRDAHLADRMETVRQDWQDLTEQ